MTILKTCSNSACTAARVLSNGGIAVLPTDTVYGFSGLVPVSKQKLITLKKRDVSKNFIQLIAEPADIFKYTDSVIPKALFALWPCALTLIVTLKDGQGLGAFRCPGDEWLRSVIKKSGSTVYSTSVNYSGAPLFTDIAAIRTEFEKKVDLIIDGGNISGAPSTIADVSSGKPVIVREGGIKLSALI